ncbi:MAG: HD-GYP domain-containing protein [Actinomycetia bacterium]|nr:HD-GYP domain-containing protein [Actinomycetes bacterium]
MATPWWPRLIKTVMFLVPLVAAMIVGAVYSRVVGDPVGVLNALIWWIGLMCVTTATIYGTRPLIQKLSPLAFLCQLTLVFPDEAPARFKMAIRQKSVRDLQRRLTNGESLGRTPQDAAENVIILVNALNEHDRRTRGHSERVRAYSDLIAADMKLPAEDREKLHWAALVHDVGKLAVPPEILGKDGRPSNEEWLLLRQHPAAAGRLLVPLVEWLGEWVLASTQHHERWDGKGYPRGLAGTDISLAARIVAVADAYDAMTSIRSYKTAWSRASARQELASNAGTQFDPRVVRAFLSVPTSQLSGVAGPLSWLSEFPRAAEVIGRLGAMSGSAVSSVVLAAAGAALAVGGLAMVDQLGSSPSGENTSAQTTNVEDDRPDGASSVGDPVVVTSDPDSARSDTVALPKIDQTSASDSAETSPAPSTNVTTTIGTTTTTAETLPIVTISVPTTVPPATTTTTAPATTTPPAPSTTTTTTTEARPPGGYVVADRSGLQTGNLEANSYVHLITESAPTTLVASLTILAPTGNVAADSTNTVTLPAGTRVCSSIIHAQRKSGSGTIDFDINFVGTILGFAVTDTQLAGTSWFHGDAGPTFYGIEGSDHVSFDGTTVSGSLSLTDSPKDLDDIRVFVGC